MIVDKLLENCKIMSRDGIIEGNIAIEGIHILDVVKAGNKPEADETIDLEGKLVIPGCIDPHVHFRDPGFPEKEDFKTGSLSAAFGGITTVLDMPNNKPFTDSETTLLGKRELARIKSYIDYGFHFMVTKNNLNMLSRVDVHGYKAYLGYTDIMDYGVLQDCFGKLDSAVICVHAEDSGLVDDSKFDSAKPESVLSAHPREAEIEAVKKVLDMEFGTNRLHFCHITTGESLDLIKNAGGKVSCEVTPHHLFLDSGYYSKLGNLIKIYPPIRDKTDVQGLWNSLSSVNCIGTDHAPHTLKQKQSNKPPSGAPGVETMLPLLMDAVNKQRLSWGELVRLTTGATNVFDLDQKGSIEIGKDADLVVLDRKKEWTIKAEDLHSKCGWTPYEGWKVKGAVEKVFLRGELIINEGNLYGKSRFGEEV